MTISLTVGLLLCLSFCQVAFGGGQCDIITNGGYLTQSVSLSQYDTPCDIENDLIIGAKTTLTLNEGTELRFAPGVMLAVNGTLLVKVTNSGCM